MKERAADRIYRTLVNYGEPVSYRDLQTLLPDMPVGTITGQLSVLNSIGCVTAKRNPEIGGKEYSATDKEPYGQPLARTNGETEEEKLVKKNEELTTEIEELRTRQKAVSREFAAGLINRYCNQANAPYFTSVHDTMERAETRLKWLVTQVRKAEIARDEQELEKMLVESGADASKPLWSRSIPEGLTNGALPF